MDKFLTKDNVVIAVVVTIVIIQSNYFATKLDIAHIENEILKTKVELKKYADDGDRELLHNLDTKYQTILNKLDSMK